MPTEQEKAEAAEILAEPIEAAPPPFLPLAAIFSLDGTRQQLNPKHIEWAKRVNRKLVAIAVLLGFDKEQLTAKDWYEVARALAVGYHPSFKPPKAPGREPTRNSPERHAARKDLVGLVEAHLAALRTGRRSVSAILPTLRKNKRLPAIYRKMKPETLRQEITIAMKEAKERRDIINALARGPMHPEYNPFSRPLPGIDFLGFSDLIQEDANADEKS